MASYHGLKHQHKRLGNSDNKLSTTTENGQHKVQKIPEFLFKLWKAWPTEKTRKNYTVSYITQIIKASRYKLFPTSKLEAINLLTTWTKTAVMSQTLISKHGSTPEASARAIPLQKVQCLV